MRILRVLALAALPLSLSACAARLPPPSTFVASEWAAVESIAPGTTVEVRYVAAGPPAFSYSFRGKLVSVNAVLMEIATVEGRQRLLSERVLSVATVQRGGTRAAQGAAFGALTGAILGFSLLSYDGSAMEAVMVTAPIGLAIGALTGALAEGRTRTVVYRRLR